MEQKSEDSIQVFIRVRPGHQEDSLVVFTENEIKLDKNQFGFDKVFPPSSTQEDIFNAVGKKILRNTLQGYNGCIFAYGQTGSGKTYTMVGQNKGVMQRSFTELFDRICELPNVQSSISCSYFQIYNEQINDLLDLRKDKKMMIRQDSKKGVFVEGITEERVCTLQKLLDCLSIGMRNRRVGETLMNRQSSRSHSIFTIALSLKIQVDGKKIVKTPKLHFVDLAGSERQKMTAASGQRLKEAGNINKSLSTLGMVINALTSEKPRNHIPYRDSKLTTLLRQSLGGNSKTFLVATISCSVLCFQETLSTLNFANRAKMVKVKASLNEESFLNNIQSYKEEIRKLKAEISLLKRQNFNQSLQSKQRTYLVCQKLENSTCDLQFKQLSDKITLLSDRIPKNSLSPTLEKLIEEVEKIKRERFRQSGPTNREMVDEDEQNHENLLLEYLITNKELLEKMHNKVDEYIAIKAELKSFDSPENNVLSELKASRTFQRQHFEQKLQKKEQQIIDLYGKIKNLNKQIQQKGKKVKQLKRQTLQNGGIIEEKQMKMSIIKESLVSLENETIMLKKILSQASSEKERIENQYQHVQSVCKYNKEMYIELEEKFLNEKTIKEDLQFQLKEKINKISQLQKTYNRKLQDQKEQYQEKEEQLSQQIQELRQTIIFNKNLIVKYHTQLNCSEQRNDDLIKRIRLTQNILQDTHLDFIQKSEQLHKIREQYTKFIEQNQDRYEKVKCSYEKSMLKYDEVCDRYFALERKRQSQFEQYCFNIKKKEEELTNKVNSIKQIQCKYFEKEKQYAQQRHKTSRKHAQQLENIQKIMAQTHAQQKNSIVYLRNEIQTQKCKSKQYQIKYESQVEQKEKIVKESKRIIQQLQMKVYVLKESQARQTEELEKMEIQKGELNKVNEQIVKQNYTLKSKVKNMPTSSRQELLNKVNFYEDKFKMMSIQYQNAIETVKKLKNREISQAKKISFLEQNEKNLKIVHHNSEMDKILNDLKQQNKVLKKENQQLISKNGNKSTVMEKVMVQKKEEQLYEKQELIKCRIIESLERFGNFQNDQKERNLDDLMRDWEKMVDESKKNSDNTLQGIKKEKKMMAHNSMIQKENILLQGQVRNLTKSLEDVQGIPRKRVKHVYQ